MVRHLVCASIVFAAALTVVIALPTNTNVKDYKWETKYYENLIDHFSFDTDSRYKQKYLVNWDSFKPGGPVFFYAGNEGLIENFAENTGFMWEIAPEFSAVLVFAEHRYYGESMPFGNDSLTVRENRAYLSSEQALADFAELLHYLRHSDERLSESPVIAFGGSYGGMLAAWFRMKYPHIIQGAIAASAPVVQFPGFTPCRTFNDIVQKVFQNATPNGQCDDRFGKAFQLLRAAQKDPTAKKILSATWHLCTPLETEKDIDAMIDFLEDFFGNVAMVNYPYPANFIMDLPGNPVTAMCEAMELPGKNIVDALAAGFKVAYNHTGKAQCWNWTTSSAEKLGTDAWDFQACTEMVMPMCTRKGNLMFPPKEWDFEKFTKDCFSKWGVRPRPEMAMTNYGSHWLKAASNIVFSNGDLDPWSGGGVYLNITGNSVWSLLIRGGAHHLDLRDTNPADPLTVTIARDFEKHRIHEWISTYKAR